MCERRVGRKPAEQAAIVFAEQGEMPEKYEAACFYDGKRFMAVGHIDVESECGRLTCRLPGGELRYSRIEVPQRAVAVKHLEVYT